ncbi:MAG: HAMP domain-containing histidine kinase [Sphingomonas sp.]|uniref:sensor histidine kinase n=1 Tax=Sphingomonas sp. TaxID=28214 RepID=UPI0026106067|nr:HAMP domain-containing sensor histidine kinase [Sphingomonas sp.]MDK2770541.1 HAMP domain-containing histidine kinase [Sphingomonas sp.]
MKRRLIGLIAVAQGFLLVVLVVLNSFIISSLWISGTLGPTYSRAVIEVVADALDRRPDGRLGLRSTSQLQSMRNGNPDMWFIVRDARGDVMREGVVPAALSGALAQMDTLEIANLSDKAGNPLAIVERLDTGAGRVQIIAYARGTISWGTIVSNLLSTMAVAAFLVGLMAIATIIVTPLVVRRAVSRLEDLAKEAAQIDIKLTGARLSRGGVPTEIMPLVDAFNAALARIDEGYERHRVFMADAAHELRTPIAIISTRVASLRAGKDRDELMEDSARLGVLTGQLLDLGRLDAGNPMFEPVDIVGVTERVVADLAPLAFAAGYDVDFAKDTEQLWIRGDEAAIERAISNLIQNAVNHAGRSGTITINVRAFGEITVRDQGPGIDKANRDSVFQPFHRLDRNSGGAGLGLNLVRRIMRLHGGDAIVEDAPDGGACFRLIFRLSDGQVETTHDR